jgi:2,5-furandicarboxylate decarboxylase 1
VLTHYAGDGGPFVTTGVVLCTDPATGRRGMGIHRMMVKGGNRMGHPARQSALVHVPR